MKVSAVLVSGLLMLFLGYVNQMCDFMFAVHDVLLLFIAISRIKFYEFVSVSSVYCATFFDPVSRERILLFLPFCSSVSTYFSLVLK
jgi:hypothetical protein